MFRFVLILLVGYLLVRGVRKLFLPGRRGSAGSRESDHRVEDKGEMVRDPVCGTYVAPGEAIALRTSRGDAHFCSTRCRDEYLQQENAER